MRESADIPCARTAAYPLRPGNRVLPLIDGEPAFRRIAEAVEAARASVWVTVAFLEPDVRLPDGRGTLFDLLDRAAARGIDTRALFWREPDLERFLPGARHFAGNDAERAWLRARGARFLARWDHLPRYCHHQKSWVVDAGQAGEVAFVGGINLDAASIVPPGHPLTPGGSTHDLYVELHGPAATDVHHNFAQRWNEASECSLADGCWPDRDAATSLPFPTRLSSPAGDVPVQITRTVRAGRYRSDLAAPGAAPFPLVEGERSTLEQYVAAIDAAERTVYLENQFFAAPQILERVAAALERGVIVVAVVPGTPMEAVRASRRDARTAPIFAQVAALARYANFMLAGLAARRAPGSYEHVYVHAKIALVDDVWATIGSTNIANRSFYGDTELNASFWDAATVRALRVALLGEHLGVDTAAHDDRTALALFQDTAIANRQRRARGEALSGLAVALDPGKYGA